MSRIKPKKQLEKFGSVRDMLDFAAASYGESVLYRYFVKGSEINEITYSAFRVQVDRLGTALSARGLRTSTIAILSESRPEWMTAFLAVVCGGGVAVPMDRELMEDQLCNFLERAEAEAVFCSAPFAEKIERMRDRLPSLRYLFNFDGADAEPETGLQEDYSALLQKGELLLSDGYVEYTKARFDTAKPCALLFTSGTTGTSKGVLLSQDNITACLYHSVNAVNIGFGDVLFSVLPMHHTYELVCGELGAICVGCTVCLNNSLKYFLRNIRIFRPTAMILVPLFVETIYKKLTEEIRKQNKEKTFQRGVRLTKLLGKARIDLRKKVFREVLEGFGGRLRTIVCGGAPLDPELVDRFDELGIFISQGYGITECAPLVCVVPYTAPRRGSVGLPAFGTRVKIVLCGKDGRETNAPAGEVGEICVKSPQVMIGYYRDERATEEAFNSEGFFRTGDIGYLDEDGYLYITGRKKNVIILANGKNVYPEELEEYLAQIPLIRECVVLAREKEGAEPIITAVIYPDFDLLKGKSDEEIIASVKEKILEINRKLPSFKQVRSVELRKTEFEKTTTRKIKRYTV